jgi:hypothetical protein
MSNLVKVQHKVNVPADHNLELQSIWSNDNSRDWSIYTKDQFRRFWDITVVEHRST